MIAEEFHYNPEYLSALYSKAAGITLTASVNRARLDIAKRLLSDRSVTIKEAAYSCGFSDEKYFMRVFRRAEGMTPEQYRAALGVK
jgi:AraC-like DNA-binding protein